MARHDEYDDLVGPSPTMRLVWLVLGFVFALGVLVAVLWVANGGLESWERAAISKERQHRSSSDPPVDIAGMPPTPFNDAEYDRQARQPEPGSETGADVNTGAPSVAPPAATGGARPVNPPARDFGETSAYIDAVQGTDRTSWRPEAYPGQSQGRPSYLPPPTDR